MVFYVAIEQLKLLCTHAFLISCCQ